MRYLCLFALVMLLAAGPVSKPATRPSPEGAARAERLKAGVDHFGCLLEFSGQEEKPYYRLYLTVQPVEHAYTKNPFVRQVQITPEAARRIIDHLAADGTLDEVADRVPARGNWPEGYSVELFAGEPMSPKKVEHFRPLGFDVSTLRWLDGFRTALDGDAAKEMDVLLGRLAGHRKGWEKGR